MTDLQKQVTAVFHAARRVEAASKRLDATAKAARIEATQDPDGFTGAEAVLAYHRAWIEVREAVDELVAIPPPLESALLEMGLAVPPDSTPEAT